ncbi:MAG TPA: hypothetical protein PLY86_16435 [bacterium]|nr:hypothetical protein [bacterium]
MALNRTTLITELKTWWAQQDTQQAPEGLYGKALDLTAYELLRKCGGLTLRRGSFTTVASQQAYDIPTDRVIIRIPGWTVSSSSLNMEFGQDIKENAYDRSYQYPEYSRSSDLIDEIQARQIRLGDSGRRSWNYVNGQVWLSPIPTASDDLVVYEYHDLSDGVSRIPPQYEYCLICGARSKVARAVSNSLMKHGFPRTDHGLQLSDRAAQIQSVSDQAAQEYRDERSKIWLDMGGIE